MTMTRGHFKLIADTMLACKPAEHWDANKREQWRVTVRAFSAALVRTNPNFKRDRFMAACGYVED
jgi:hypothetical protein